MIIVGKRDIKRMFVLLSFRNGGNFDYHGKICQHLLLPLHQKPKHLNLPLRFFPTKGNSNKHSKKKEHIADKREVLQAHAIQVQILQNEFESLKTQLAKR